MPVVYEGVYCSKPGRTAISIASLLPISIASLLPMPLLRNRLPLSSTCHASIVALLPSRITGALTAGAMQVRCLWRCGAHCLDQTITSQVSALLFNVP